ncbi:STIV orfB116 family protein [Fusobacterium necrophorum subsp. funduliforme]
MVAQNRDNLLSAIGHESTALIMTELLDAQVQVNRIQFAQENNQKAIVFKLNGRAPEGVILSKEEIEAIGYKFQLLEKID